MTDVCGSLPKTFNLLTLKTIHRSTLPNNYFQFKQFTIHQDRCVMKVCTDTCLLGAMVAEKIVANKIPAENILDIGCGTGLLSLMLAQKTTAVIDAVEIDTAAFNQATENFEQSPWKERLNIFNADIKKFKSDKKYDCIISNPPFFEGGLKSNNNNKNAAKHDTTLTMQELLTAVQQYLQQDGFFVMLLPFHRVNYCIGAAEKIGLFLSQKILVKQTPGHDYFRGILFFSKQKPSFNPEEIIIKNEMGNYTTIFTELLKDYYLYL